MPGFHWVPTVINQTPDTILAQEEEQEQQSSSNDGITSTSEPVHFVNEIPDGELLIETKFRPGIMGNYEFRPNLTYELSRNGPGEQGEAVVRDGNEEAENKSKFEYGFNIYVSDKVSVNRSLRDTRQEECKFWHYPEPEYLPKASVVIIFRNEAWSALLRTVHSVLNRSPPELIEEVILVDDASDKEHLKEHLEEYIYDLSPKIRLIRNTERQGLILTRTVGAKAANMIEADRWEYYSQYGTRLFRGLFEWGLVYKEREIPKRERERREHESEPIRSPTHAGGLLAIHRDWFRTLGWYDPLLEIWGGEQYELSFKVWQCGGELLYIPCSRVGHVYRNSQFSALGPPNSAHKDNYADHNHLRVVSVWMDEYKEYFYRANPNLRRVPVDDISEQLKIRERLGCKSFKWYMENVAYDVEEQFPFPALNAEWGELRPKLSDNETDPLRNFCWDTAGSKPSNRIELILYACHGLGGVQAFRLSVQGELMCKDYCISDLDGVHLRTRDCDQSLKGNWTYSRETEMIKFGEKCAMSHEDHKITLEPCDPFSIRQKWFWNQNYNI